MSNIIAFPSQHQQAPAAANTPAAMADIINFPTREERALKSGLGAYDQAAALWAYDRLGALEQMMRLATTANPPEAAAQWLWMHYRVSVGLAG